MKLNPNPKYFISWGLGVQSTTLCVMSALEDFGIKKVDHIITADTKFEHSYTGENKDFYVKWLEEHGMKVYTVNNGNAEEIGKNNLLPLWTDKGAPLRRMCTFEYKISPIRNKIRELLGVSASNTGRTRKGSAILYLGISYDEAERMSDSDREYIINQYPLIDIKFTRQMCLEYLESKRLPLPKKSCCINCPFQGAKQWRFVKDNYPEDFQKAVEYDRKIRKPSKAILDRGIYSGDLYIWKKHIPLEKANFDSLAEDKLDACDSGYCFV
jgi:hypothetical protein